VTWGIRVAPRRQAKSGIFVPPSPRTRGCGGSSLPAIRETDRYARPHSSAPEMRVAGGVRGGWGMDDAASQTASAAPPRGTHHPQIGGQLLCGPSPPRPSPLGGTGPIAVPRKVPLCCTPSHHLRVFWGTHSRTRLAVRNRTRREAFAGVPHGRIPRNRHNRARDLKRRKLHWCSSTAVASAQWGTHPRTSRTIVALVPAPQRTQITAAERLARASKRGRTCRPLRFASASRDPHLWSTPPNWGAEKPQLRHVDRRFCPA
jgi:hypothetical protein